MNKIFPQIEKLLFNESKLNLFLLNNIFKIAVPFNQPHKFSFVKITKNEIQISLPYIRANKNHVGGIHACALATLGEFCAGMLISRNLGISKYRIILASLEATYHYQGKKDLIGQANFTDSQVSELLSNIEQSEKYNQQIVTEIHDINQNHIATIKTNWQLKEWSKVKTKA